MNSLPHDPATLLVVDADALTLTATAAMLHFAGYECHCARDAEAAWKAARSLSLDLIICDTKIDRDDGIELCREFRQGGLADVPVIFLTSTDAADTVRRAREGGGQYCLRKPVDPEVLLELVDKALWMPHLVSNQLSGKHRPSEPHKAVPTPGFAGVHAHAVTRP